MDYTVKQGSARNNRGTVTVYDRRRVIAAASVDFVRWLHESVPVDRLDVGQRELVRWYKDLLED